MMIVLLSIMNIKSNELLDVHCQNCSDLSISLARDKIFAFFTGTPPHWHLLIKTQLGPFLKMRLPLNDGSARTGC